MREIGGYIELEYNQGTLLHEGAVALNCGRNCLAYLIRSRGIRKIALPWFLCDSVVELCRREGVAIRRYSIEMDLLPGPLELEPEEWLYLVNYYGQLTREQIRAYVERYGRVIVDQAQAYFDLPEPGVDTLYTCRKFFGVADGAFLYTNARLEQPLPRDESFGRMRYLMGRMERTASEFYQEYTDNNHSFAAAPVLRMSRLTENLLRGVDYDRVRDRRTRNFACLHRLLGGRNKLALRPVEGAYAYPLWLDDGAAVRKALLDFKIYIPTLWPNVVRERGEETMEYQLALNILPIPCDQRYDAGDMEYICQRLRETFKERERKTE